MAGTENKVKFNIKNVHACPITSYGDDGMPVYDSTIIALPGAVSIGLDPSGETSSFYADGIKYYTTTSNQGYEGDLEMAKFPNDFREKILNETKDTNGLYVERSDAEPTHFALMFEFDGDKNAVRHVLYDCVATRPAVESSTTEETKEPGTETSTITASPLSGSKPLVKGRCEDSSSKAYANWYKQVVLPDATFTS